MLHPFHSFSQSGIGRAASLLLVGAMLFAAVPAQPQEQKPPEPKRQSEQEKKENNKSKAAKDDDKNKKPQEAQPQQPQMTPAELVAEFALIAYGSRPVLEKARASIQEEGTIRLVSDQGDINGNYKMRFVRKEKSWQDLLRIDLELNTPLSAQRQGAAANVKYTVAYNGASIWSAQNGQYVNPTPEAEAAFRAQLSHDYTTLLRYKEDGSKLELKKPETVVGIECNVLELTTPNGEKTTFYISGKTYKILHLDYELQVGSEQKPIKYRISYFYAPPKVVQNTLVPTRRVMYQDGKLVQEVIISDCNYSAKFEPETFQHLP